MITCVIMGMLLWNSSCGSKETKKPEPTTNVRLFTVKHSETESVQDFPGRVTASEEVNLAFKVSGTLKQIYIEEGNRVKKGQLIAELDPRDYQIQLDATEAEYRNVRAESERVIALYADSVSTAQDYDKARYGLRQITAKYENAQNQLADTKIYAPFDGYVQKRLFDPPTVLAAGMPVATLVSENRSEIEINIPASAYIRRDKIASFSASFDFIPDHNVPLSLAGITPKANANQLYTVRLIIPQSLSPQPSPGMNSMVHVIFKDTTQEKAKIPATALFQKDGQSCVWIYDEKNERTVKRPVIIDRLDTKGFAIVKQGVAPGERIIATGVHKLNDHQRVNPIPEETKTNIGGLL